MSQVIGGAIIIGFSMILPILLVLLIGWLYVQIKSTDDE